MKQGICKILLPALICSAALSAAPIGTMSLGIVVGGGVNVFGSRIDFFPPTNTSGLPDNGEFATGNPTNITYSNGVLTSATDPFGYISDLDFNPPFPPGGLNFILFSVTQGGPAIANLAFDITGIGPGGTAQNALNSCVGVTAVGVRCSPALAGFPGGISPFVLTENGNGTDVSLTVNLRGTDANGSINWVGGFTTQIPGTPDDAQTTLTGNGIISNTWSFTAHSVSPVPEPGTLAILGSGLFFLGLAGWRRKSRYIV